MSSPQTPHSFDEIVELIEQARQRATQAVNTQLIDLYWQVGAYIDNKLGQAEWGDAVVSQLAGTSGQVST